MSDEIAEKNDNYRCKLCNKWQEKKFKLTNNYNNKAESFIDWKEEKFPKLTLPDFIWMHVIVDKNIEFLYK